MSIAQPAVHAAPLNAEAPRPPLRRRLSATFATAALVLAGLTLAPVAPASAAPIISNATALANAFNGGRSPIALDDNITVEATDSPIAVPPGSSVILDLNGKTLTVTGAPYMAGIGVPAGATLTITDSQSGGTVTATGGRYSAGIGGSSNVMGTSGTVIITSGTVTATGGEYGAGIGGYAGTGGTGATVSISGGTVDATGGVYGAGIGGGQDSAGGTTTITGGTVTAIGGEYGAGIGGGQYGAGGTATITGGTLSATGGSYGAGIGGGFRGGGATVAIGPHGTVTAAGGADAPTAIGAGYGFGSFGSLSNAGTLTIPAGSALDIPSGATAGNSGTLNIAGTATGAGTIANTGTIVNTGTIRPDTLVTINNFLVTFAETYAPDTLTPVRVYATVAIPAPAAPTRTGYTFAGWFADAATAAFDFTTPITADLTLTARWAAEPRTVSFDSNGGSSVDSIKTGYDSTITAPTAPTRPGYTFAGWFADDATTAFDFTTPITADLALTAQWDLIAPPIAPPTNTTPAQTVNAGDTITISGTGFTAGQQLQLWLHSDPVRLGTLTADSDGAISSRVTIPANTPAGEHHLVLIDAAGTEYTSGTITVTAGSGTPTPTASALPPTGADPALPLGLALLLLLAGVALTFRRAHRTRTR